VRYLICSDVHLGNHFSRYKELEKIIEKIRPKSIILVGDFFDNTFTFKKQSWSILNKLQEYDVTLIRGNHDNHLTELFHFKVVDKYEWVYTDKRCAAIHGHQFDHRIKKDPNLTTFGSYIYKLLSLVDKNRSFCQMLQRMYQSATRINDYVRQRSIHYAKQQKYNLIICGHVHYAEYTKTDVEYFNTGDVLNIPSYYVAFEHDKIELRKF
jgi:UDP-2,3-diacylglucosamine pyrophosphatase LpxH